MIAIPDIITRRTRGDRSSGSNIVVLPDLQNYTGHGGRHFEILEDTMSWIVAERERQGIGLVVQVGDLTDNNQHTQWRRARQAFRALDGILPYVVTVGNHDLGYRSPGSTRSTPFNQYFHIEDNPLNENAFVGSWSEGHLENSAYRVNLGNCEWLVLALEFGPREGALNWANRVLASHPDLPALLVTHEYVDQLSLLQTGQVQHSRPETYNSPYTYSLVGQPGGVNCGEEIWHKLVKHHPKLRAVVCGHHRPFKRNWFTGKCRPTRGLAQAHRVDYRADGSRVDQIMFNAQWAERGGNGWLMMLHPSKGGKSVKHRKFMAQRALAEW